MAHCYTCGGHGFKSKDCPECGRKAISMNLHKEPEKAKTLITSAKNILIPQEYIGVEWSRSKMEHTHMEDMKDPMFKRFLDNLEKMHAIFASGKLSSKSAVIIAPPQYGKVTFAYSCMQFALLHNFKVASLLDTQEVKRLITLAAERPKEQYLGISYEDYINSDVVFITVTKTTYRNSAYQVIQEMLDKRSRRGLATFFISRYNLATLSLWDSTNTFGFIKDYNGTENSLKYPAILNYWRRQPNTTKGE